MYSKVFIACFLLIFPLLYSCSQESTFSGKYAVPGFSVKFMDCIETADGGYLFAGRFDTGDHETHKALYGYDRQKYPSFIRENFYSNPLTILYKVNAQGDSLWTVFHRFSLQGNDICATSDGGFLISGFKPTDREKTYENDRTQAPTLIKIDANGKMKWSKVFDAPYNSTSSDVIELANGEILLLADHEYPKGNQLMNPTSIRLIKLKADGTVIEEKDVHEDFQVVDYQGAELLQTKTGDIYVVGTAEFDLEYSFLICKLDEHLNFRGEAAFNWKAGEYTKEWNWGYSIAALDDGIVVCGSAYYQDPDCHRVLKLNSELDTVWCTRVESHATDLSAIKTTADGTIYFASATDEGALKLAKLDGHDGHIIWEKTYPEFSSFELGGLALSSGENLIIAGSQHTYGLSDWWGTYLKIDSDGTY